jgi:hypothetical protein
MAGVADVGKKAPPRLSRGAQRPRKLTEATQLVGGRQVHRPRVTDIFTEHLASGRYGYIVCDITTMEEGIVTAFEAGPYPQSGEIRLYKFKLSGEGDWRDLALERAGQRAPPPITWGAPWAEKSCQT